MSTRRPARSSVLISSIVLVYGGYQSMRQEGVAARDAPTEIETIRLTRANGS